MISGEARELGGIRQRILITLAAACMLSALVTGALAAETPKRGGILNFVNDLFYAWLDPRIRYS